jgi:hypothetical protein
MYIFKIKRFRINLEDLISYKHKSVELLFKILELVEVWTPRSMEL